MAVSLLRLLLLQLLVQGSAAVMSHISEVQSESQLAKVRSCFLQKAKSKPIKRPVRTGKEVRLPCEKGKYSKDFCKKLKREALSEGCALVDLWQPKWYTGPPREVVMYGDSVAQQFFQTLICQMAQHAPVEAPRLEQSPPQGADPPNGTAPGVKSKGCKKRCWRFGSLSVCMVRAAFLNIVDGQGVASCLLGAGAADVHVLNAGVHVNSDKVMASMMASLREFVSNATEAGRPLPHLVWRETTPQHFLAKGGNFVSRQHIKKSRGCIPRSRVNPKVMRQHDYRNRITFEHLRGLNFDVLHVWEMLVLRTDLHPSGMDCTHWCDTQNSPIVQLSLLMLSDVLKRYWGGSNSTPDAGTMAVSADHPVA
uniref:Uncharacterized protein n=1 Tax=Tetraselmis sp. GSL018 TaxID=582737 RepID=A0A061RWF3_9CHLO|mmetsp:Transcript_7322/g.17597  ORF Transcript_7322/g.17597 Transcript_7322/m.17597 type:complete len:366 (+) Transcript_7322:702-1799(+)